MVVAGDSTERAIELVRRMEESKYFRDTRIQSTTQTSQPGSDSVQVEIGALYITTHEQEKSR
jgi:hypothetical protein